MPRASSPNYSCACGKNETIDGDNADHVRQQFHSHTECKKCFNRRRYQAAKPQMQAYYKDKYQREKSAYIERASGWYYAHRDQVLERARTRRAAVASQ